MATLTRCFFKSPYYLLLATYLQLTMAVLTRCFFQNFNFAACCVSFLWCHSNYSHSASASSRPKVIASRETRTRALRGTSHFSGLTGDPSPYPNPDPGPNRNPNPNPDPDPDPDLDPNPNPDPNPDPNPNPDPDPDPNPNPDH
eukprot:scaffold28145_cov33-Phaeocystis_antarctica.AAC.1